MACRLIDSNLLSKAIPPPPQSHQIDCWNVTLLCNLIWGSIAVPLTRLHHLKANVCVICVSDYVYMTRLRMYTCVLNYMYIQDNYVNMYTWIYIYIYIYIYKIITYKCKIIMYTWSHILLHTPKILSHDWKSPFRATVHVATSYIYAYRPRCYVVFWFNDLDSW